MKIGRNDPCPCGSGKKYKKCCLPKEQGNAAAFSRIRNIHGTLLEELLGYADVSLGKTGQAVAYGEFLLGRLLLDNEAREQFVLRVFLHWFFLKWRPEAATLEALEISPSFPPGMTIAEIFSQKKGEKLEPLEKAFLLAAARAPLSFYEVTDVLLGKGLHCVDLLTDDRLEILEPRMDLDMLPGDILFMSATSLEGIDIAICSSPLPFPASRKAVILALRAQLEHKYGPATRDVLAAHDAEIRKLFLDLLEEELDLGDPTTEDGYPFEPRTLYYALTDPQAAFEALHDLCAAEKDELLEAAEFDAQGRLSQVDFTWDELEEEEDPLDTPCYGFIRIEAGAMTVELDCAEREEEFRELVDLALGDKARYQRTEIEDMDSADFDDDLDDVFGPDPF